MTNYPAITWYKSEEVKVLERRQSYRDVRLKRVLQYQLLNWDQLFFILVLEYFLACSPSPIFSKIVEIEYFALGGGWGGGGGHLGFKCTEGAGGREARKIFCAFSQTVHRPEIAYSPYVFRVIFCRHTVKAKRCTVQLPFPVWCLFVCLFVYRSWRRQMGDWTASVTRETSAGQNTTKGNFLFTKIANVEQASKSKKQHLTSPSKQEETCYYILFWRNCLQHNDQGSWYAFA